MTWLFWVLLVSWFVLVWHGCRMDSKWLMLCHSLNLRHNATLAEVLAACEKRMRDGGSE